MIISVLGNNRFPQGGVFPQSPHSRGRPSFPNLSWFSWWWTKALFPGCPPKEAWRPGLGVAALPLLAAGLLLFSRLHCPLLEPEEARYAEIPRQMLAEGQCLTPVWHGQPYWQKPPLFYWLVMVSYSVFGVHDWAARLVPCGAACATVLVTFWWGRRTAGMLAGLGAASILTLTPRFVYQGGMLTTDGLLGLWLTAGLATGHVALSPPLFPALGKGGKRRIRWRWWLLSAVATGLGVLTKGPVTLVLVLGPILLWHWLDRRVPRLGWVPGAIFLAVVTILAGPWFCFFWSQDPTSAGDFFWLHNLRRFLTPFDHQEPLWYYLPALFVGMLPWSLLAAPLGMFLCRRSLGTARRRTEALGFFVLAFLVGLAFFSLSGCKRPGYVFPLLPPGALLLGTFLAGRLRERECLPAKCLTVTTLLLGLGGSILAAGTGLWSGLFAGLAVGFFGILALFVGLLRRRWSPTAAWGMCGLCVFVLACTASQHLLPAYHRKFALRGQVRRHQESAATLPVACYPKHWDSISFYLQRSDVKVYTPAERDQMGAELEHQGATLVFIKNLHFPEFVAALPASLEFVPCRRQGTNVRSGVVCRKMDLD